MKFAAAVVLVFALSAPTFAESGIPDSQTLSAMGLSDLRILSDAEGLAIRGKAMGAKNRVPSAKMLWYLQGREDLRQHVSDYKDRLANRTSDKAAWYHSAGINYRGSVASFQGQIGH
jgi:hypothetical protein